MIHHISIAVRDPLRAARVLGEIWQGTVHPFLYPGSYHVMPFDRYGSAIVVFPEGTVWSPGTELQTAKLRPADVEETMDLVAVHAAISVPVTQQQIEQIGQREGWRVLTRNQTESPFRLVEFWLENRILFEFFPPEFETEYLNTMQPSSIEKILGQPIQTPVL